ncbi:hypothetical protein [Pelomonas sp. SE-A7]|uniref:hypothetical protein n=1 Tax=Pelomonas sp. SE-A7 TaxID=3054953 RepID=UPI00259CFF92|nr:hypothetical protein [Pelomonas sp. SE-A7]MDM4767185.1 hypothetical protein [Pelomonas sp. SE-A7]
MPKFRSLQVRDCPGVLWAIYREYEGRAIASFEGDLSALRFEEFLGCTFEPTAALPRQTQEPLMDFVCVPITSWNLVALQRLLAEPGMFGEDGAIIHTQVSMREEPILVACDNFHDDCTVASAVVPASLLARLQANGVLRGYSEV